MDQNKDYDVIFIATSKSKGVRLEDGEGFLNTKASDLINYLKSNPNNLKLKFRLRGIYCKMPIFSRVGELQKSIPIANFINQVCN